MVVASATAMTTVSKLLWIGAAIGAGAMFVSRGARGRRGRHGDTFDDDATSRAGLASEDLAMAEQRGADDVVVPPALSQVDPEPLSHMAEAIDPDATTAAHQDIPEQRERLAVPGKNLP
jgi:hypothetical protein